MEESEFVIDKFMEDKDKILTAIGSAFDFIPVVKAFNIVSAMKESQNLKDYLKFLELSIDSNREKVEALSEDLSEENIKEIFFRSLTFVSKTLSDDKIKRFSSILGNSLIISEDEISKECRLDSIELCDELNERDILVLGKIHTTERISIQSISVQIDREISEVHMSCKKLESRGLIVESEELVGTIIEGFGNDNRYKTAEELFGDDEYEVTMIGNKVIKLLAIQDSIVDE